MKCTALVINRGRCKLINNAKFDSTVIIVKTGFRQTQKFFIPKNSKYLDLEKKIGNKPLWVCDELTHKALGYTYDETIPKSGYIKISNDSDPLTDLKLNVLTKTAFWEMLAKKLKMGLFASILYMGAGYGILRFIEYLVRIIFLKQG